MTLGAGTITFDASDPGSGSIGQVNGGNGWVAHPTFKEVDNNIRVKCDNYSLLGHQSNLTSTVGSKPRILDKSLIYIPTTQRGNPSQTCDTQVNLSSIVSGNTNRPQDTIRTTGKETLLHQYLGGSGPVVSNSTKRDNYTEGVTSTSINKTLVKDYIMRGTNIVGHNKLTPLNLTVMNQDNNLAVSGNPHRQSMNTTYDGQKGKINCNTNRIQREDSTRTDSFLVAGLASNPISVYNADPNAKMLERGSSSRRVDLSQNEQSFFNLY